MSFDINKLGGYGTGTLGDYFISDGLYDRVNSYSRVTQISGNVITIDADNAFIGDFDLFTAGVDVLIHISAAFTANADKLGNYLTAKITLVERNILTLDKDISTLIDSTELSDYTVQLVTIPNFDSLTLSEGAILIPQPFNIYTYIGGIIVIRCKNDLIFDGGHIDLTDAGISTKRKNQLRPLHWQETASNGESDFAKYSAAENYLTAERLMLNAGDGIAAIFANRLVGDNNSRIGNPASHGAAYCRGAANSVGVRPSNITNIGGSTILIAAEQIENFTPKMIAKYRSTERTTGKGLCRCYIASNTKLPNDEGLYSYDVIADETRLMKMGISNFGDGSFGDIQNARMCLNNYAKIVGIKDGGKKISYVNKTFNGLAPLAAGSLIMVQVIHKNKCEHSGKFTVAKVLTDNGYTMTLDFAVPVVDLNDYLMQVISIPQFRNYKQNTNFNFTKKFNGELGGVCALACSETLDLTDGQLNVENCGGAKAYGKAGLNYIGNAQIYNSLPLGAGHGSVFILAKKLILNSNSRIGATYSGLGEGQLGGYSGAGVLKAVNEYSNGGYVGGGAGVDSALNGLTGGSAFAGGTQSLTFNADKEVGGLGSNSKDGHGLQGAHLFIVADKIEGFTQAAISTGGSGEQNGGASQGGSGSFNNTGGGSGGFAFIYTN